MTRLVLTRDIATVRVGLTARAAAEGRETTLIGPARAGDIAVNVVLPHVHARGRVTRDAALSRAALHLYRSWPALQDNEVTREMEARLAEARLSAPGSQGDALDPHEAAQQLRSARRQQGLMELYDRLFVRGASTVPRRRSRHAAATRTVPSGVASRSATKG